MADRVVKEIREAKPTVVDFTGYQDRVRWNSKLVPDGEYAAVLTAVHETDTNAGDPMLVFTAALKSRPTYTYPYNCPLTPEALGFLGALYRAVGAKVPDKRVKIDATKFLKREIGVSMIVDDYQADKGRDASKIDAVLPASDVDERPIDDGPAAPPRGSGKRPQRRTEPELDDDSDTIDDVDELDLDEML